MIMGEKEKFSRFSLLLSNLSMDSEDRARDLFTENADRLMKVEILACIISHGGLELENGDFSGGSTVTRNGLERACKANNIAIPIPKTKKTLLKALLSHVGSRYVKGDVSKIGSTVEKNALLRVYKGMLSK